MKKQLTFLLALFLGVMVNQGYAQFYSLNIIKWTGASNSVGVNSIDKITFSDNNLVLKYSNANSESLDFLSIRKITFTNNPSGNINIIGNEKAISVSLISPNTLRLNNLPIGKQKVEVYSTTGVLVQNTSLDSDLPTLNIGFLNRGVYIISTNNQTIKFVRP